MADFGYGELNTFFPNYAGIDWREAFLAGNGGEDQKPVWFEDKDTEGYEDLVEQLTQENCCIYINHTNPSLDTITVNDPRDGTKFFFVRMNYGGDFDDITRSIRSEVGYIETKYPVESLANKIFDLLDVEVEDVFGIPDEWETS